MTFKEELLTQTELATLPQVPALRWGRQANLRPATSKMARINKGSTNTRFNSVKPLVYWVKVIGGGLLEKMAESQGFDS